MRWSSTISQPVIGGVGNRSSICRPLLERYPRHVRSRISRRSSRTFAAFEQSSSSTSGNDRHQRSLVISRKMSSGRVLLRRASASRAAVVFAAPPGWTAARHVLVEGHAENIRATIAERRLAAAFEERFGLEDGGTAFLFSRPHEQQGRRRPGPRCRKPLRRLGRGYRVHGFQNPVDWCVCHV